MFGAFVESFKFTLRSSPHPIPWPFLKITSQYWDGSTKEECLPDCSGCPHYFEKKGEVIKAVEHVSRRTHLYDVHIHDDEDSHSTFASLRWMLVAGPEPSTLANNSSRCSPACISGWKISKQSWFDFTRQMLLKKMQRLVSRRDYSNKSIHCESHNHLVLPNKELRLSHHHSMTGNPCNLLAT